MTTPSTTRPLPVQLHDRRPRCTTITPHVEPETLPESAGTSWTLARFGWTVLPPLALGAFALIHLL